MTVLLRRGQDRSNWEALILGAIPVRRNALEIVSLDKVFPDNATQPLLATGSDLNTYVVKPLSVGRSLGTELIVSRIGQALGCPVPDAIIVNLPQVVIDANRERLQLDHRCHIAGPGFGSRFLEGTYAIWPFQDRYPFCPENHVRISLIALLFGLTISANEQYLRGKSDPGLLFTIDFHMFMDGPHPKADELWEVGSQDTYLKSIDELTRWSMIETKWFKEACRPIGALTDEHLARIVAEPLDEWGFDLNLRVAIAATMARRRDDICQWSSL